MSDNVLIPTNEFQTPITQEWLETFPDKVQEEFLELVASVPMIKWMIGDRPRAKDLPRDKEGKIIVDITHPHILEDVDYFRPAIRFYQENGCYTFLKPNSNPRSEYRKWLDEEIHRCREGYVRESDGEWVTGLMYWFLNYCPIMVNVESEKHPGVYNRVEGFPAFWEGIYYRFHYLDQARKSGKHAMELSRRGSGKSFSLAGIMSHNLLLGENEEAKKRVTTVLTAYTKEYLSQKDGTFTKFTPIIDFCAANTEFPRLMLTRRESDMIWVMGYKNSNGNVSQDSSKNAVMGLSVKDDEGKVRGKRGFILFEEMGNFYNFRATWDNVRDSVSEGSHPFALLYALGTAGDEESDFSSIKNILYNPRAYEILAMENVYDKEGKGAKQFAYFFPSYISRAGCMDKDGNSDVTKALMEILMKRWDVIHGGEPETIMSVIAQMPITPEEAILKAQSTFFPAAMINERLRQLDQDPHAYDNVYVGTLIDNGKDVVFVKTDDIPIRDRASSNTERGALEIYAMPPDNIPPNRYIAGADPIDNDEARSDSLYCAFIFDLYTDLPAAMYFGRKQFANDNFELTWLMCRFFNATLLYEAHPYDQIVRLPNGETKQWGDVEVGDELIAPNGSSVSVIDIPIDGVDDIYKVRLIDGRTIEASSSHIWKVRALGSRKFRELTTKQMFDIGAKNKHKQRRFILPDCEPVVYRKVDVPIDPYTLGLLIAEGSLGGLASNKKRKGRNRRFVPFAACEADRLFYETVVPYPIKNIQDTTNHVYIDRVDEKLASLGLAGTHSYNKFIPKEYLFNDYETRLEFLKGLMDGDGCSSHKGACVFITTSRMLADDIMLLCRSLGIKCMENKGREDRYEYFKTSGKVYLSKKSYRIAISSDIVIFKLPRKIEKQHTYLLNNKGSKAKALLHNTPIDSIEYVGKKKCKCVTVDSNDGLYLIGDYVVTHNCNRKMLYAYFQSKNALYMLADCPDYLRAKGLVKYSAFGSGAKGVSVNDVITGEALKMTRDWMQTTIPMEVNDEHGGKMVRNVPKLFFLVCRVLLKEWLAWGPGVNTDTVSAFNQVMLYRQHFISLYGGNPTSDEPSDEDKKDREFLMKDWQRMMSRKGGGNIQLTFKQ